MKRQLLLIFCITVSLCSKAQPADSSVAISYQYINNVSTHLQDVGSRLDKKMQKAFTALKKRELKMRNKLARKDSAKAIAIFGNMGKQYKDLEERLGKPAANANQYIPSLDSLSTSLNFLQQNPALFSSGKHTARQLSDAITKAKKLQDKFQQADELKKFIRERKDYLEEQLQNAGFAKQLKKLDRQAYYYQAQVAEYKALLKDHKKLERKTLELLSKTKAFQDFMRQHSILASLFRFPDPAATTPAGLAGLQTRVQVNALIQQQLAAGGPGAQAQFTSNLQQAQGKLDELRNKITRTGSSSSDDLEMPEGFKPNGEKTKSFLQRLEYGANVQSTRSTGILPVTTDIGLSAGYKLNDRSVIGIGGSYRMGWGEGIRRMKITHQGIGLRTYIDWKIKGSFWISGGYEQNYRHEFRHVEALMNFSAWQQSGLIGISKVVSLKTKLLKKTSIKLLWDLLSYRQVPRTEAILFRVGYNF